MPSGELLVVDVKYWNAEERHAIAWRSLFSVGVVMEQDEWQGQEDGVGQPIQGGFVPLREKALRRDGTVSVRLIAPGWGSSGFYPVETLRRDGPMAFKAGTKMYWNHPTMAEESARPEGDLRDLAAVLVGDARWEEAGQAGPGLYADAKVFEGYAKAVEELAPHIGVSIRASGRAMTGEAEGRQGSIINAITAARSVDFVTEPGAGGRVVEMFEAARGNERTEERKSEGAEQPVDNALLSVGESINLGGGTMDELEKARAELAEALARIGVLESERDGLKEGLLVRDASAVVAEALAGANLPSVTVARLQRSVGNNPPVVDGKLNEAALRERVAEAVAAETAYLQEAAGWGQGRIEGMGGASTGSASGAGVDMAVVEKRIGTAFAALGFAAIKEG